MRSLGDKLPDTLIVGKVLRSLGSKYNFVFAAIGEAKDHTILTMTELARSLQAHEALLLSQDDTSSEKALVIKSEEKALITKGETTNSQNWHLSHGRGRNFFRGRGRSYSRGRGRFVSDTADEGNQSSGYFDQRSQASYQRSRGNLRNVQCYHCKKFGHIQSNCWYKDRLKF